MAYKQIKDLCLIVSCSFALCFLCLCFYEIHVPDEQKPKILLIGHIETTDATIRNKDINTTIICSGCEGW